MKSNYEIECDLYALYGNPQQDAMDYEFNASYDRYDGWGDPDPSASMPYEPTPEEAAEWEAYQEKCRRNEWDDGTAEGEYGINDAFHFACYDCRVEGYWLGEEEVPF